MEERRKCHRLVILHKILIGDIQISVPEYVTSQTLHTRRVEDDAPLLIPLDANRDFYKYSFWPRSIVQWNALPPDTRRLEQTAAFKKAVCHTK